MESNRPTGTPTLVGGGGRIDLVRRIVDTKSVRFALAILWTMLICVLCWTPRAGVPTEINGFQLNKLLHIDKMIHAMLFFGFAVLWYFALPGGSRWASVMAGGLALALLTEYVQGLPIVGRTTDFWDLTADTAGAALGTAAAMSWLPRLRRSVRAGLAE